MVSLEALIVSLALVSGGSGSDVVLLNFTADRCQPCRMMAPVVERLEGEGYPVRRINVDQQPQLAQQFKVEGIPCFVLVQDGKEIDRVQGAASYDLLVRLFERVGYQSADTPTVRGQSPEDESPTPPRWMQSDVSKTHEATATNAAASAGATGVQQMALASSVRLRVAESDGQAYGTGTIIDVYRNEALIVTCGHLFRESKGQGVITVELLAPGANSAPVPGQLIAYDADDRDIALVAFRPGVPVAVAPVASGVEGIEPGAPVFSVGCDHGKEPSIIASRISAVDKYSGRNVYAHNIEVAGQPVDGRSGGGLFDAQGRLIGVCNAADPADNEGIYAGLKTIHWQLDQLKLARVYQKGVQPPVAESAVETVSASAEVHHEPGHQPLATAGSEDLRRNLPNLPNLLTALETDAEVICVIRGRDQKDGQVLILDQSSREMLTRYLRDRAAAELATISTDEPTVRGQSRR